MNATLTQVLQCDVDFEKELLIAGFCSIFGVPDELCCHNVKRIQLIVDDVIELVNEDIASEISFLNYVYEESKRPGFKNELRSTKNYIKERLEAISSVLGEDILA